MSNDIDKLTTLNREFVASVLWNLPGVRDVRAYAVLDKVKHVTRIPL